MFNNHVYLTLICSFFPTLEPFYFSFPCPIAYKMYHNCNKNKNMWYIYLPFHSFRKCVFSENVRATHRLWVSIFYENYLRMSVTHEKSGRYRWLYMAMKSADFECVKKLCSFLGIVVISVHS